jgi:hypothetical protein
LSLNGDLRAAGTVDFKGVAPDAAGIHPWRIAPLVLYEEARRIYRVAAGDPNWRWHNGECGDMVASDLDASNS